MCMFSNHVEHVSNTNIFSRVSDNGFQYTAYQMNYGSSQDTAMILPLPVADHSESALRFIDLSSYATFFKDLKKGFPVPVSKGFATFGGTRSLSMPALKVHDVGDFEASFVPTLADFDRLDERFKLPTQVWDKMPQYRDFGFAVFKLKPGAVETRSTFSAPTVKEVHPMAFVFQTASPNQIFFPCVHVHDGEVHNFEDFDHTLYWQDGDPQASIQRGAYSEAPVKKFAKVNEAKGLLRAECHLFRQNIQGMHSNEDILIPR